MTIKIDHGDAKRVLIEEHEKFKKGLANKTVANWKNRVDRLSELCPYRKSSTFIAALGTAILAKSVNCDVDVLSILDRDGKPKSYSARSLADNVWAKNRGILRIDLGANGANPLNNTPFIGKARIDEIKNVRNKQGYDYLLQCLDYLSKIKETGTARHALRGFISSRSRLTPTEFKVGEYAGDYLVTPTLVRIVNILVERDSEDGRIAQAIAAGLLKSTFLKYSVDVGHVNDPDRNFPLDIVITDGIAGDGVVRLAVEVKDKPVDASGVISSIEKAKKFNVRNVVYLAISKQQNRDYEFVSEHEFARDNNCSLVVFTDWSEFVKACVSFSEIRSGFYTDAYKNIGEYLVDLGASAEAIELWEGQEYKVTSFSKK